MTILWCRFQPTAKHYELDMVEIMPNYLQCILHVKVTLLNFPQRWKYRYDVKTTISLLFDSESYRSETRLCPATITGLKMESDSFPTQYRPAPSVKTADVGIFSVTISVKSGARTHALANGVHTMRGQQQANLPGVQSRVASSTSRVKKAERNVLTVSRRFGINRNLEMITPKYHRPDKEHAAPIYTEVPLHSVTVL